VSEIDLAGIERALRAVKSWKVEPLEGAPPEHKARGFTGAAEGWGFVLVRFEADGSERVDGTAVRGGTVVHLSTPGLRQAALDATRRSA
jgi:hypothetical protein